jgi:hypothetical protein
MQDSYVPIINYARGCFTLQSQEKGSSDRYDAQKPDAMASGF